MSATPQLVAQGLDFPTSLSFDAEGTPWVAESGLPFAGATPGGRIVRIGPDGRTEPLLGELRWPVNGLCFHDGGFFIAEGGYPGRISRWTPGSGRETVLDGLPGLGNYHTNMTVVGPDGWLYFSQGALTNSGVIGLDAYELGWLRRLPHNHDAPGYDVTLAGLNLETENPLGSNGDRRVRTGAFSPFGVETRPGQRIEGRVPCTASVMRCRPDGSGLELVAWGLRNAYGLLFLPDGRLLATDQGADDRGSRPIGNAPDLLFEVRPGAWYGWPDFVGRMPVTDPRFRPERGPAPERLLANHGELPAPEPPLLEFAVNAAATKMDRIPEGASRWPGQILVALFGDERPMTGPAGPRIGRSLARIDPSRWSLHPLTAGPFRRPIDVRFHPLEGMVYVLDFGEFEMGPGGVEAEAGSGALWKIPLEVL
ncbi:MAG TPA: sugar dehydrogenase [Thermoanaerobaculia bacterium]|nr:sugar dehydrogenase [Thermoanaerobaculia bacterium]